MRNYILILISILLLLSGCSSLWGKTDDIGVGLKWTDTPTPFLPFEFKPSYQDPSATPASELIISPQVPEVGALEQIWIGEAVPAGLYNYLEDAGLQITNDKTRATYQLDTQSTQSDLNISWVYAVVASFSTINDNINWSDLIKSWHGETEGSLADTPIWMDSHTFLAISSLLGQPSSANILIAESKDLLDILWEKQPALGIVPFEDLQPRLKVLSIDGLSTLSNEFILDDYPLKVNFSINGLGSFPLTSFPESNRDPNKFTSLVMTGVTALVRATAGKMERNGVLYPGKDIRNWLLSADITHISNEIPFYDECPFPDPNQESLVFCSSKKYIALLEDIGTDIVELTGNHFQDYGSAATLSTLDMYNQEGWIYFGGGANLEDARAPKIINHNGNKLAFMGCNIAGPQFAWATNFQPGASPCDLEWMDTELSRLVSDGYIPIVTFQYVESYSIHPLPDQVEDFRAMAAAGAAIISGSQAHLPQTMEFFNKSFIHYGLGNLFFDQMDYPVVGTRREFIDRHIFYDGKYIGTELLTAFLEDYSRPRPMTNEERAAFLQDIFQASGW